MGAIVDSTVVAISKKHKIEPGAASQTYLLLTCPYPITPNMQDDLRENLLAKSPKRYFREVWVARLQRTGIPYPISGWMISDRPSCSTRRSPAGSAPARTCPCSLAPHLPSQLQASSKEEALQRAIDVLSEFEFASIPEVVVEARKVVQTIIRLTRVLTLFT